MKRSLWLGYLIAPLTGPLLYAIIALFIPSITENKEFSFESWFLALSLYSLASYIGCLILGAPLVHLLKKFNKLSFLWLAVIGSSLYAVAIYVILFVIMNPTITGEVNSITINTLLIGFGLGLSVITVFSYTTGITRVSK